MNHLGCEISGTDDQFLPEVNYRHVRAVPNQHIQESEAGTACDTFQNELGANCQLQDWSGTWKGRLRSTVFWLIRCPSKTWAMAIQMEKMYSCSPLWNRTGMIIKSLVHLKSSIPLTVSILHHHQSRDWVFFQFLFWRVVIILLMSVLSSVQDRITYLRGDFIRGSGD